MRGITVKFAIGTLALALALALALTGAPAGAADFVMKMGTATQNETQHEFLKMYKAALEKASGGRIEVQVYPASQLGPIPREIEGVQLGSIQGYVGPVDFYVGLEPRYGIFSAPMLFRDEAHLRATIHDPALEPAILEMAKAKRMIGVATFGIGTANYAAKKPLLRLADFDGKKLRINGTALERAKMSALGATGIAMPLSEVMPALSQGTIDGTISGTSVFVAFKMNQLVNTITVTNDTMLVSLAVVSQVWLEKLPPDLQKMVVDTAHTVQTQAQAWQVEFTKQLDDDWIKLGGKVHQLPAEDVAAMKAKLGGVADEVSKDQPAVREMLVKVRQIAAKH